MKYLLILSLSLIALTSTGQVAHCTYNTDSVRTIDFELKTRLPIDNTFTVSFSDSGRLTIINKQTGRGYKIVCTAKIEDYNPTSKSGKKYEYVEYEAVRDDKDTIDFAILYNHTDSCVFSIAIAKDEILVVFFLNPKYTKITKLDAKR